MPDAYFDMHNLATSVAFGQFVRNIHRWSAHLMVLVVCLHMLRVFYSGAYKPPRQFNWVIGVGLLLLTLALSFTGYLLPWDQLAFWAITVGTNIAGYVPILGDGARHILLGSTEVGAPALLRFYVLHIYVLPLLDRVGWASTSGGSARTGSRSWTATRRRRPRQRPPEETTSRRRAPMPEERGEGAPVPAPGGRPPGGARSGASRSPTDSVFTWPHMLVRHVVVGAATVAFVFALAIVFNAPLKDIANPNLTPAVAKAPWYFAGLQELPGALPADGRGRPRPRRGHRVLVGAPLHRPEPGLADQGPEDGRDRFHRARPGRARPHPRRHPVPRARSGPGSGPGATCSWSSDHGRPIRTSGSQSEDARRPRRPGSRPGAFGRRAFLNTAWKVLGAGLVVEAAWTSYDILNPSLGCVSDGVVDAGPASDYAPRARQVFLEGRFY